MRFSTRIGLVSRNAQGTGKRSCWRPGAPLILICPRPTSLGPASPREIRVPTITNFEISFPLHFQSVQLPGIGSLPAPMLTSNRRYAYTTKIPRPLRLPRLPAHHPTPRPLHHHVRPNLRLPHLRNRAQDRPVCVTKSPAIPATPSRTGAYQRTSNTLNSRILRHNFPSPAPPPSRGRPRRLPPFGEAPHISRPGRPAMIKSRACLPWNAPASSSGD